MFYQISWCSYTFLYIVPLWNVIDIPHSFISIFCFNFVYYPTAGSTTTYDYRRGSRCISGKVDDNLVVGGEVVLLSQIRRHSHRERERERRAASRRQPTARRGKPGYMGVKYVNLLKKNAWIRNFLYCFVYVLSNKLMFIYFSLYCSTMECYWYSSFFHINLLF